MNLHPPLLRGIPEEILPVLTLALEGDRSPFRIRSVPGQRHPDKTTLSVYMPRLLMQRLRRLALERNETVTAVLMAWLEAETKNVSLTPEDHEQIARETRAAMRRSKSTRKGESPRGRPRK